jgi:hypothetical protein
MFLTLLAAAQGSLTGTYSAGVIPTGSDAYDPLCNGPSTTISITLPAGGPYTVTGVNTAYSMTAQGGAWMSEQQSQLHFQNTATNEPAVYTGTGFGGTMPYSRNNIAFANGTYPGGTVLTFEMRAWRTWPFASGCNTTYQFVPNSSWSVTVNFTIDAPPVPVQDPGLPSCATGTNLTVAGSPNPGQQWYWQTTAGGTSTANPVSGPYAVFANGTYFVRAFDTAGNVWSPATSVTVSNFPVATDPPAPVADQNPVCVPGTDITMVAAPGGTEYYWQGTTMGGTSSALPATAPFAVTSTGTYYVAAYETATQCWSNTVGVTVTVNSDFPDAPIPVQGTYVYCASDNPMDIEVTMPPAACPISVNIFSTGWGDATTWSLTDASANVVLSGGPYGNGYNIVQSLPVAANGPYTLNITSTLGDNFPNYSVTVDGSVVFSGSAPANTTTNIGPITCPPSTATPVWSSDALATNQIGSGTVLNALGTSVLPIASEGTFDFYVSSELGGCLSGSELVQVIVSAVSVDITAVDETCTNYSNGTFSITNVNCGTAPFSFSVDGGAFGPAPTDLTAGTYEVVVQDVNTDLSAPIMVTVGTTSSVIPNTPTVVDSIIYACVGDGSVLIEADGNTYALDSLLTTMAAGNGFNANMFSVTAINTTTITEFAINANPGTGNYEIYYRPNDYLLTPGSNTSAAGWISVGSATGVVSALGTYTPIPIPVGVTIPSGSTYSFHVAQIGGPGIAYTNGTLLGAPFVSDANITFNQGHGGDLFACTNQPRVFNGLITYDASTTANVEWFDTPSLSGVSQGSGSPFETVGTAVLPSTATAGSYDFYAFSEQNGCYSVDAALVTVNVEEVNVEIDAIDASCNNQANGSFAISTVLCGDAPFTFSVDGGAFGAAPTDLLPGTYEVIVQDFNGELSASYFVTVGEADAPSDLYMETITDDGGQVSWTSNGSEVEWYVEWGLPGFIPGTGTEFGSAMATDTFWIITGADDNTNYDVYVAANCGPSEVVGDWTMVNFTTECGIYTLPFIETFEDDSETRVCWKNEQEVGAADWTYQAGSTPFSPVTTAYQGLLNAQFVGIGGFNDPITKLVSPRFDFAGQDSVALVFAYAQPTWGGDQNVTKVYVASETSPWTEIQSYNNDASVWTVDTLFLSDTVYQIAFEGINNWGYANAVDDVQFLPCTLVPGTDGSVDACRLDNTVDLNSVIVQGETFGKWFFQNQTFIIDDTIADISLLPAGSYDFYYVVETPCAIDTTVATITVFGPSTAGNDGVINVCRNEPFDLYAGLSGLVDHGGTWYDPSNNPMGSSQLMASNIPGQFNYDYIVTNGVCPNDTSNVVVNVSPSCDWLNIEEVEFASMDLFPNPTTGVIYITNEGSTAVFSYELTDLNGKVIASRADAINGTETTEIDLGKLEPGMYLIKVANENVEHTFRVIKH